MNKIAFLLSILLLIAFSSCNKELTAEEKQHFTEKGKEIAQATAKTMLAEVGKNMKEGGVAQAAPYCHAHATEITDKISGEYDVEVKRTSHKLRNPDNEPNLREMEILEQYLAQKQNSEVLKPVVEKNKDGSVQFYAPIMIAEKCMVCHGELGNTLKEENYETIKNLYPVDQATGFRDGDIRGVWSIRFKK
jgi:hypothetical protein